MGLVQILLQVFVGGLEILEMLMIMCRGHLPASVQIYSNFIEKYVIAQGKSIRSILTLTFILLSSFGFLLQKFLF